MYFTLQNPVHETWHTTFFLQDQIRLNPTWKLYFLKAFQNIVFFSFTNFWNMWEQLDHVIKHVLVISNVTIGILNIEFIIHLNEFTTITNYLDWFHNSVSFRSFAMVATFKLTVIEFMVIKVFTWSNVKLLSMFKSHYLIGQWFELNF